MTYEYWANFIRSSYGFHSAVRQCVKRYHGNYKVKSFFCWDQYLSMAFAQLTYWASLRDIETCLRTMKPKLHHVGLHGGIARNTLANANSVRNWRIYADFAQILIRKARRLYADEDFGVELKHVAYALDATVIDLCLSLFPWAKFHKTKAAVKLHTLLDLRGSIPTTVIITPGNIHEVNILDELRLEPMAIYIGVSVIRTRRPTKSCYYRRYSSGSRSTTRRSPKSNSKSPSIT
ncbi:DUF4372 domain-containing protein [Candidatus Saganbacteria bacterium]|nr:DUF4372 domain-containing protein [Candidatus Saganbacteria bacterium]